jgi:hypothetical protein
MKKLLIILIIGGLLSIWHAQPVWSGEVDILVEKLVEKRILTQKEADEILKEIKKEAAKERAETVEEVKEAITKGKTGIKLVELPKWIQKTHLKGDFRLRYQMNDREGRPDRHRGRYRLRLGLETEIADNIKVAFGLATGSSDPRSTNQSFTDSFDTPDIRLEYAYVKYTPFKWAELIGGKMKNPIWRPTGLLWDTDIHPEGGAAKFNWKLHSNFSLFINTGIFVLDERGDDVQDPIMYALQPGFNWKINNKTQLKSALVYYGFSNVEGTTLDHSSDTNTLKNGVLKYDYDSFGAGTELGFKNPFSTDIPYFALVGDYIKNPDPSSDNEGFLLGWKLGHKKVKEKGQWQVSYWFKRLERDAWLDIFPDADHYGGETSAKVHNVALKYGLEKNVDLGIKYFYAEKIHGNNEPENLLQVDLQFNF